MDEAAAEQNFLKMEFGGGGFHAVASERQILAGAGEDEGGGRVFDPPGNFGHAEPEPVILEEGHVLVVARRQDG